MRHRGCLVREAPNDAMPAPRNVRFPSVTSLATAAKTWLSNASEIVNVDARGCLELGRAWRTILETLLYRPVKTFLEGLGFVVKGEIGAAICWRCGATIRPFS